MRPFLTLFCSLLLVTAFGQNSLLSDGQWVRFIVRENGMYRLRGSDLQAAGLSLNGIDPQHVHVAAFPGGPLPQLIGPGRPPALQEIAIRVVDGDDGSFDPQDYIIFYAEGASKIKQTDSGPSFEFNPYDDVNYVYAGISAFPGKRIESIPQMTSAGPVISSYRDVMFYKPAVRNLLESGRKWYGQVIRSGGSAAIPFPFSDAEPGGQVIITSAVMAQSFSPATFTLTWNGISAGQQTIDAVPDFKNPPSNNPYEFSVKGKEDLSTFTISSPAGDGTNTLRLDYAGGGSSTSDGFIDYILLEADRRLVFTNEPLLFAGKGAGRYEISFSGTAPLVWDISDFYNAAALSAVTAGNTLEVPESRDDIRMYAVFSPESLPVPEQGGPVASQNLPSAPAADLLIVTHPDFLQAANELAAHRVSHNNYSVVVATTEQIYHEYAGGRQDVSAIRNFARELFLKGDLDHILLMGKGTYDYLGILNVTANYVPVYESRNSLEPLASYASDDFYGFMEEGEGEWAEVAGGNHTLDIGVGRLPVTTVQSAAGVVKKIIAYDLNKESHGDWRTRLAFVADDEDFNLHHRQAERLALYADTTYIPFRQKKIYLGAFNQEAGAGGQSIPEANKAINDLVWEGSLIMNYTGHGGTDGWAQERVLTRQMIREWRNNDRLPLFVTATCAFGRHDNPREESGGEMIITLPNGGGIALLSTGRPVFSSSNFSVNRAFYASVFNSPDGQAPAFGTIFRDTKNASVEDAIDVNRVGNRNFTLLGDPSQRIAYPGKQVVLTAVTGDGVPADTLKAGAKIRLEAEVRDMGGALDNAFSGTADVLVTDKPVSRQTTEEPEFNYQTRENVLFSGKVKVSGGRMAGEFIVPRNISQKAGTGRIQIYAVSENNDAIGASDSIVVGGTSAMPVADTDGPDIMVFFGDSTNTSRTNINDNTLLLVRLSDASGINVSGYGVGNNLTAEIDGEMFILNEYYKAIENDFTTGWAVFPLNDLTKGKHLLTIKAWDVYNNSGTLTVEFTVADPGTLVIQQVMNYPQPAVDHTTFTFDHNRTGETLEVEWTLIGGKGEVIQREYFIIEDSPARVELASWENGSGSKFLAPGLYFYSVVVRSTLDGASAKKYQKLILID